MSISGYCCLITLSVGFNEVFQDCAGEAKPLYFTAYWVRKEVGAVRGWVEDAAISSSYLEVRLSQVGLEAGTAQDKEQIPLKGCFLLLAGQQSFA